jgi:hypothetical protein
MTKFKPAEVEPESTSLSANRKALIDLNEARAAATAEVATLRERLNRLGELKAAVGPIENELARLDSAEAAALADWSATPDEPAPSPDIVTRDNIMGRLAAARQRIAGAEMASASVEHALGLANTKAGALEREVPVGVASVLLDEAYDLLPEITEATARVAKAQVRFSALREFILSRAEASRDVALKSGFFQSLEALDIAARHAAAGAPPPDWNAPAEWKELARELGDVPIGPTPTLPSAFNLPQLDQWKND